MPVCPFGRYCWLICWFDDSPSEPALINLTGAYMRQLREDVICNIPQPPSGHIRVAWAPAYDFPIVGHPADQDTTARVGKRCQLLGDLTVLGNSFFEFDPLAFTPHRQGCGNLSITRY